MTWDEVCELKKKAESSCLLVGVFTDDEYELKVINEHNKAVALLQRQAGDKVRAHREKKFKDALARYVAEQGDNT